MKFGFGKRVKPRKFDYLPRYYDEAKEELEQRLGKYDGDLSDQNKTQDRIRAGLRQRYHGDAEFRSIQTMKSNLRLVYIIGILCLITYLIMRSDRFVRLIESFG